MSASIIQREKECFCCRALVDAGADLPEGAGGGLHRHHIIHGTAGRKLAEKHGLWVYLCPYHHQTGREAVHNSKATDTALKRIAQLAYEQEHSHEEWMKIFQKSYL